MAQTVKRLPTVQETRVRSLGQEGPLEKDLAIHSSTLAWKIPWMEERGRLQLMGLQRVGYDWQLHFHFHLEFTKTERSLLDLSPETPWISFPFS